MFTYTHKHSTRLTAQRCSASTRKQSCFIFTATGADVFLLRLLSHISFTVHLSLSLFAPTFLLFCNCSILPHSLSFWSLFHLFVHSLSCILLLQGAALHPIFCLRFFFLPDALSKSFLCSPACPSPWDLRRQAVRRCRP